MSPLRCLRVTPLCKPGTHRYQDWQVRGETKRVVCIGCGRTFVQVMEDSPRDLDIYRRWLAEEVTKTEHVHPRPLDEFVRGCPGCKRVVELLAPPASRLAVRTAVKSLRDGLI